MAGRGAHDQKQFMRDGRILLFTIHGENGGDKLVHGSGGISSAAGGVKLCHL